MEIKIDYYHLCRIIEKFLLGCQIDKAEDFINLINRICRRDMFYLSVTNREEKTIGRFNTIIEVCLDDRQYIETIQFDHSVFIEKSNEISKEELDSIDRYIAHIQCK